MADRNVSFDINARDRASSVFKSVTENVKKLAAAFVAFKAVGSLKEILAEGVEGAAAVQKQFSALTSASNFTAQEIDALKDKVHELASSTELSVTSLGAAEAMTELTKSGLSAQQVMESITPVIALAQGAQIDFATAAGYVTANMATFQMEAEDASRIADVLTFAANATKTSVTALADALSYAGPSAKAAGMSFEETTALLALMQNAGIDGTRAGTALGAMLSNLQDPASTASKGLDAVGISSRDFTTVVAELIRLGPDAQKAVTGFGLEAGPALKALMTQGTDAIHELNAGLLTASGTSVTAAKVMLDNYAGAKEALDGIISSMKNSIGDALLEPLTAKVRHTTEVLDAFASSATFEKIKGAIVSVVTTFVHLTTSIGGVVTNIGQQVFAIASHPAFVLLKDILLALVQVTAAAIAGFASSAWQSASNGIVKALDTIKQAADNIGLTKLTEQFSKSWYEFDAFSWATESIFDKIKRVFGDFAASVASLAASLISPAWDAFIVLIETIGKAFTDFVKNINFDAVKNGIESAGQSLGRFTKALFELTGTAIVKVFSALPEMFSVIGGIIKETAEVISDFVSSLGDVGKALAGLGSSLLTVVTEITAPVGKVLWDAFHNLAEKVGLGGFVDQLADVFGNAKEIIGDFVKNLTESLENAQGSVSNFDINKPVSYLVKGLKFVRDAIDGFDTKDFMGGVVDRINDATKSVKDFTKSARFEQLKQEFAQVATRVLDVGKALAAPVFNGASAVFKKIADSVKSITPEKVNEAFDKLGKSFDSLESKSVFDGIKQALGSVQLSIQSISFDGFIKSILKAKGVLSSLNAGDSFAGLKKTLSEVGSDIVALFEGSFNSTTFNVMVDSINLVVLSVKTLVDVFTTAFYTIKMALNGIAGAVSAAMSFLAKGLAAVMGGLGDLALSASKIDALPDSVQRAAARIGNSLTEMANNAKKSENMWDRLADQNLDSMGDAFDNAAEAGRRTQEDFNDLGAVSKRLVETLGEVAFSAKQVADTQEQALSADKAAKARELSTAVAAYSLALQEANNGSQSAKAQLTELKAAVDKAKDAYQQSSDTLDEYQSNYSAAQLALEAFSQAHTRYQLALKQAAAGNIEAYASLDSLGRQVDSTREFYISLMAEINKTADTTQRATQATNQSTESHQKQAAAAGQAADANRQQSTAAGQATAATNAQTAATHQSTQASRAASEAHKQQADAANKSTQAAHENANAHRQMSESVPTAVSKIDELKKAYEELLNKSKYSNDFAQIKLDYAPLVAQIRSVAAELQNVKFDSMGQNEIKTYLEAAKIAFENSAISLQKYKSLLDEAAKRGVTLSNSLKIQDASLLVYSDSIDSITQKINSLTTQYQSGKLGIDEYRQKINELYAAQNALKDFDLSKTVQSLNAAGKSAQSMNDEFKKISVTPIKVDIQGLDQANAKLNSVFQTVNQFGEKTLSVTNNLSPAIAKVTGDITAFMSKLQYVGNSTYKMIPEDLEKQFYDLGDALRNVSTVNLNADEIRALTVASSQMFRTLVSDNSKYAASFDEVNQAIALYGESLSQAEQKSASITSTFSSQTMQLAALNERLAAAKQLLAELKAPTMEGKSPFVLVDNAKIEAQKNLIQDLENQINTLAKSTAGSFGSASAEVVLANEKMTAATRSAALKGLQLVQESVDKKSAAYENEVRAVEFVQMSFVNQVKISNDKQYEAVRIGQSKIEDVYKAVERSKENSLKQIEGKYKKHIETLVGEERKYKDEVTKIQKEIEKLNLSGAERLRELKRGAMSDEQARADRVLEIEQNLQKARDALSEGNTDKAKEFAKKAEDASANVASAVERDGKTIVSQQDANAQAVKLMTDALKIQAAALEQVKSQAQGNADATTQAIQSAKDSLEKVKQALESSDSEHKIKSNVDELVTEIDEKLKDKKTEGQHDVKTNAGEVAKENEQLNGQETQSTHTVVVEADTKPVDDLKQGTTSTHTVKADISAALAAINSLKKNTSSTHTVYVNTVERHRFGGLVGMFAEGGSVQRFPTVNWRVVPGTGDSDSVPAALQVGGYVLRKKAVKHYGSVLNRLHHFEEGGYVPAMLTPGERLYQPRDVNRLGAAFFDSLNSIKLPREFLLDRLQNIAQPIKHFANGGMIQANNTAESSETVNINLAIGRQSVRMQSSRDQANALASALRDLSRGH